MRVNKAARRFRLARIGEAEHGLIARIPCAPEIKSALLFPALEIVERDLVRRIQQRTIRREEAQENSDR